MLSDYGNYEIELNKCIKHNNSNAMKGQRLFKRCVFFNNWEQQKEQMSVTKGIEWE